MLGTLQVLEEDQESCTAVLDFMVRLSQDAGEWTFKPNLGKTYLFWIEE